MAYIGNNKSEETKLGSGEDERGKFIKYLWEYETFCECHPETCNHENGKFFTSIEYKYYEDGSKLFL